MSKDYEKLFTYLTPPEPSGGLLAKIMAKVNREKRLIVLRRRVLVFSLTAIFSAIAFVPAWNMVKTDIFSSGFYQFFSLLFSDFQVIGAYWRIFLLSLLETLPVMSLVMLLATILIFMESIKLLAKDVKAIYSFTY